MRPLHEDEQGNLYISKFFLPNLQADADVIAEIMASDEDKVFRLHWSNADMTMRAGSWQSLFANALEEDST